MRTTRHRKGSFITVPNKEILAGLDPQSQVLYLWLNNYANDDGECYPSITRLVKDCGMAKNTVLDRIEKLVSLGLIKKQNQYVKNRQITNLYTIELVINETVAGKAGHGREGAGDERGEGAGDALGGCSTRTPEGAGDGHRTQPIGTQPIELNSEHSSQIPEIIKLFEKVDPKNKGYYGNKTQRAACSFLLAEYGLPEVVKRIEVLPRTNGLPYFPTITTPLQLKDKWVTLENQVKRYRAEKEEKKNIVAF